MKRELDSDELEGILNEWCERTYGKEIDALQWQVEEDKEFKGVIIIL